MNMRFICQTLFIFMVSCSASGGEAQYEPISVEKSIQVTKSGKILLHLDYFSDRVQEILLITQNNRKLSEKTTNQMSDDIVSMINIVQPIAELSGGGDTNLLLGRLYELSDDMGIPGQERKAEDAYRRALKMDSQNWKSNFALGIFLNSDKRYGEASPYLFNAYQKRSKCIECAIAYASNLYSLGRKNDAFEIILKIKTRHTDLDKIKKDIKANKRPVFPNIRTFDFMNMIGFRENIDPVI